LPAGYPFWVAATSDQATGEPYLWASIPADTARFADVPVQAAFNTANPK
jgi:hypothetical protein